nr:immunoglobulin heavy chain junction region [Macaca mulatta]
CAGDWRFGGFSYW